MGAVFDFLMSPLGFPINPIYEYFILGIIAFFTCVQSSWSPWLIAK